jgi:hypothetical protein
VLFTVQLASKGWQAAINSAMAARMMQILMILTGHSFYVYGEDKPILLMIA